MTMKQGQSLNISQKIMGSKNALCKLPRKQHSDKGHYHPSKKAMRGLRAPSQSKPIMMKKPYGSSLVKEYWKLLDEKPMRIFDPSSGGMGIRLKAASIMLIWAK